jgi:hypothetical protein
MKSKNMAARRGGLVAALLGTGALVAAVPALAIEHGVYIAADYASFKFDRTASEFDAQLEPFLECSFAADSACATPADVVLTSTTLDTKAKGYDFWVGYQFSRWLAVEGAYLDTGKTHHFFDGTIDVGSVDVDNDGNPDYSGPQQLQGLTNFRTRGPAVAVVGSAELGEFLSVDARAGFFFSDSKLSMKLQYSPPTGDQTFTYSESNGKTRIFYGASATFWITPYFGIRGGAASYNKSSFDHNVTQVFVGIRYSYGF